MSPYEEFSIRTKSSDNNSQECVSDNKLKKKEKGEGNLNKDDGCKSNNDVPPPWFVNYMKKVWEHIIIICLNLT